jgi:hypothetical protein
MPAYSKDSCPGFAESMGGNWNHHLEKLKIKI